MSNRAGSFIINKIGGEEVRCFLPSHLPPTPPLDLARLTALLNLANTATGRLDGISTVLPDPALFVWMYLRKEAIVSSQIEGTQSSLSDLLLFDIGEPSTAPADDVREVSQYIKALNHGLSRLRELPLSLRLLREMHRILLSSGRGEDKQPGEFRTSQNWIGGSRPGNALFVPPAPQDLADCLRGFEQFLHHSMASENPLLHAALAHVHFESIHPFLDGNGRLGRALITLLLCTSGMLREPVLYLSLYLKRNRQRYYDLLQLVRLEGKWEEWCEFFLAGVAETAEQAADTARRITALLEEDHRKIEAMPAAANSLRLHGYLKREPFTSVKAATKKLGLSTPTVQGAFDRLEGAGLLHEITGRSRGRLYAYTKYVEILEEGTEPLAQTG